MDFSSASRAGFRDGYAALITVLVALGASLTIIGSFTFFALNEVRTNRAFTKAIEAKTAAESGIEDVVWRVVSGKQTASSETLGVGNATTRTTLTQNGNRRTVRAEGLRDDYHQNMEAAIDIAGDSAAFFFGVQVDVGGVAMANGAEVRGNVFSNGSVSGGRVTGDSIVATGLAALPSVQWPAGCTSTCGNADHAFATVSGNRDIAQAFTASATGPLPKVSVFLGKNGTPSADITLRIATDVSGRPDSSQISNGSAVIARSGVGATPSWIDVMFATPPTVATGAKYWIILDYGAHSATHHWNWRKDSTDGYAGHTGKSAADWSSGSASWTDVGGDLAFRLWIGGVNTEMENITVDGTARAPVFTNVSAGGSACPNPSCVVASDPPQPLPISDAVIQGWKDAAAAGGITTGDVTIDGASSALGPRKITGKLTVTNGATLTVDGAIWVVGDIVFDNNSVIRLNASYGALSGMIISDAKVDVKNNAAFSGSGNPASALMLVAAKNSPSEEIMNVDNNSLGVIYYAPKGRIKFSNNAAAKEATAYGITMDNNATVTYESGLADVRFSSGPSGGYDIIHWKRAQ
ncbi:MAG: choice-of-anchor R domain-containing protein [Patescibacteria group bacterium]